MTAQRALDLLIAVPVGAVTAPVVALLALAVVVLGCAPDLLLGKLNEACTLAGL